jgi:hypothetical protein
VNRAIVEYAIPLVVRKEAAEIKAAIEQRNTWLKELDNISEFVAMLNAKLPEGGSIHLTQFSFGTTVMAFISVKGFTMEADPKLAELLEWAGYFFEELPTSDDLPNIGQRKYHFEQSAYELFSFSLVAELDTNSESCQRIIKGTRKTKQLAYVEVDEPIYAFRC